MLNIIPIPYQALLLFSILDSCLYAYDENGIGNWRFAPCVKAYLANNADSDTEYRFL